MTDDYDKRLLNTFAKVWFSENMFGPDFYFYKGYSIPKCSNVDQYLTYIQVSWPGLNGRVLFCSVWLCAQLSCALFFVLLCSALHSFVLFCSVQIGSALFFSGLFRLGTAQLGSALFCSDLLCSVLFWSVLFCSGLLWSCSILFSSFCSLIFCSTYVMLLFIPTGVLSQTTHLLIQIA